MGGDILKVEILETYQSIIEDLWNNEHLHDMKNYIQHRDLNCLEHSLFVSYKSYQVCRRFNCDEVAVARGALLHDFFLYDWHDERRTEKLHGFAHPEIALENAKAHFNLTEVEKDIILKHMWPLTFKKVPKYRESLIVSLVDKYCTTMELISPRTRENIKNLTHIISQKNKGPYHDNN